jgi:hypothetical protein
MALSSRKADALQIVITKFSEGLEGLTTMIGQPLSPKIRQLISYMPIFDVHSRVILKGLIRVKVI